MEIRPIQNISNNQPIGQADESINQQLWDLIQQYRKHLDDSDPTQLLAILDQIKAFIEKNGDTIIMECEKNGYSSASKNWLTNLITFFSDAIHSINTVEDWAKEHPGEPLPIDFREPFLEWAIQLHCLISHPE